MSDAEQGGFNVPTNGQAIDIIRAQPGRGNVVWGARTLDGNSQDYRYIQVRRTLIYVEQTIKLALQSYVFAANDAITWTNVTSSISAFLTGLWQQGGLMGAKSTDAFTVNCGLGATMTAQDVLNGYMVVAVTLQMIHPAEFIELTFTQTMGS
jgi:phage tail sheath protein FI